MYSHTSFRLLVIALTSICAMLITTGLVSAAQKSVELSPTPVDFAAYFDSEVHDADECAMSIKDKKVVIDKLVVNPSMSCPDMFSWKLFVDALRQSWWTNWAEDNQTWPEKPFALCEGGKTGPNCCTSGNADNPGYNEPNNPALHCPYFPGDHKESATFQIQPRRLNEPFGAHAIFMGRGGLSFGLMSLPGKPGEPEPGRVIRQEIGELTVRNKDMFNYIFKNDLYNAQGVEKVFNRNNGNLAKNAPYQATNTAGSLSKIDLPISAVMIKSNWLYHQFAKDMKLVDDPAAPYIKKNMTTTFNKGKPNEKKYTGEHWLLALHISTKDTPQWVWTTFEHVNNPGRCDFTGCNDSYGYASPDKNRPNGTVGNFTAPHKREDGLRDSRFIYDLGKPYPSGPMSSGLTKVFNEAGIGSTTQTGLEPLPTDKEWLSYRLKGSQVNFTNAMGRATRLGNSITEGGFMATSSCITCHARASVAASGIKEEPLSVPLGVFSYDHLSEVGYQQGAMGIPEKSWFHGSGFDPSLKALQTDFIWGMPINARPLVNARPLATPNK